MKKKTIFAMLIALVGLFSFTACDNTDKDPKPDIKTGGALPYEEKFDQGMGKFTQYSVSGTQTWTHDKDYVQMTGYVDKKNNANEDWLISPKIDLTGVKKAKMSFDYNTSFFANLETEATVWLSLDYNGGNPNKAVWTRLEANIQNKKSWDMLSIDDISLTPYVGKQVTIAFKYLSTDKGAGTWRIKNFEVEEGEADTNTGETDVDGDGTKLNPYDVEDVITLDPKSTTDAVKKTVWVKGYIVGYYNSTPKPAIVENKAPFSENYNLMLAEDKSEKDKSKMICVQLSPGDVRTALGLKDSPTNIGKEILVHGDILKYNTFPGVKNTNAYWFVETNTGIEPPTVGDGGEIDLTNDKTAPVTSINEDFSTIKDRADIALDGWSVFNILGDRNWQGKSYTPKEGGDTEYYAQASAHKGSASDYEYWLVTPPISMDKLAAKTLSFKTAKAYWKETSSLKVYILKNDNGKTTQTEITTANLAKETDKDHTFVPSGSVDLTTYTGTIYIGFQYVAKGGSGNSTTFRIDDVEVK